MKKKMVLTLCLCLAIPAMAQDNSPSVISPSAIAIGPAWSVFSFGGVGVPSPDGPFTFTSPGLVSVDITDCCCRGDEFELWEGAVSLGTTSAVATDPDCLEGPTDPDELFTDPSYSSGSFIMGPGAHSLDITPFESPFGGGGAYIRVVVLEIYVDIDIKPGSCPNPFNGKSKGSVPVAILGTADLDVTTIDPTTLTLAGVPIVEDNILYADVSEPDGDPEDCYSCFDADDPDNFNCDLIDATDPENPIPGTDGVMDSYCGDGYDDLVVKFDTAALAAAIGAAERDDCVRLVLDGAMLDGTPLSGVDSMVIKTKMKD